MIGNAIEKFTLPEGDVFFDHSTGDMNAKWVNGYSERWPNKGYTVEQKLYSFYLMTDQNEKANFLLYGRA